MSQESDQTQRLLSEGKEAAPPNFLSGLERSAREAYRFQERARWTRWKAVAGCLAVAALVPLAWLLETPEVPSITAEQLRPSSDRTPALKVTTSPRLPATQAVPSPIEQPEPAAATRALPPATKPRPTALGQELAILARVRRALESGDAKQALSVLDQHGGDLKAGQLRLEAEVLRLEALSKLGAKQEVSRRARLFIDQHPNSPLVDRVRGFVE